MNWNNRTVAAVRQHARLAMLAGIAALCWTSIGARAAAPAQTSPAETDLAALQAQLPGTLINDPRRLVTLSNYEAAATGSFIKADDIPGGQAALRVDIAQLPDAAWKIGANAPLTAAIAKGETVTVGFYARALPASDGSTSGRVYLRVQQNSQPWPGFIDRTFEIGSSWQWYEASATASAAIAKDSGTIILQLGSRQQVIEIGQLIAVKGAARISGQGGTSGAGAAAASSLPPQLASVDGVLINRPGDMPWGYFGPAGSQQSLTDKGVFGGRASRITIAKAQENAWQVGTSIPLEGGVNEGEELTIAFAIRTVSAATLDGKGIVGLRIQGNVAPYGGFADHTINPAATWQMIRLRTTATASIPAGQAVFSLFLGGAAQVIDIGPVYVFKMN